MQLYFHQVQGLLKATYRKTESALVSRIRGDSYPRMSQNSGQNSERRITCSTALPSPTDDAKDQYSTIRPKLHVAEIISIQASERLAEILEPVYETIQNGVANEAYDSLDRSDIDNDSGFIANRDRDFKVDDYYGFTNASSISINCQDWIQCVSSPASSVYNNSLNDYETKYLEKKYPNHSKLRDISEDRERISDQIVANWNCPEYKNDLPNEGVIKGSGPVKDPVIAKANDEAEYDNCEDMLDEIMHYIETDKAAKAKLDPNVLSPNRPDGDKIIFLNE